MAPPGARCVGRGPQQILLAVTACVRMPQLCTGLFSRQSLTGSTIASPFLARGTPVFFVAGMYSDYPQILVGNVCVGLPSATIRVLVLG
jgi:hypothetical protein